MLHSNNIEYTRTSKYIDDGTLIRVQVNSVDDVGEQTSPTGAPTCTSPTIIDTGNSYSGMRFVNVPVDNTTVILSAYIELLGQGVDTSDTNIIITGLKTVNPTSICPGGDSLTTRYPSTTATVNWDNVPSFAFGGVYPSADVSSIIREIVAMDGWQMGNAMAFVMAPTTRRRASTYAYAPCTAPILVINIVNAATTANPTTTRSPTTNSPTTGTISNPSTGTTVNPSTGTIFNPTLFNPTTAKPVATTKGSSTADNVQSDSGKKSSTGAIVGGVIGTIIGLILIAVLIMFVLTLLKKRQTNNSDQLRKPKKSVQMEDLTVRDSTSNLIESNPSKDSVAIQMDSASSSNSPKSNRISVSKPLPPNPTSFNTSSRTSRTFVLDPTAELRGSSDVAKPPQKPPKPEQLKAAKLPTNILPEVSAQSRIALGTIVMAKYSMDGKFYKAVVEDCTNGYYLVKYPEYDNHYEWLIPEDVKLQI